MSGKWCGNKGREHKWFSALDVVAMNSSQVILNDWCITCGEWANAKPHMTFRGKRREVEDVQSAEGLL